MIIHNIFERISIGKQLMESDKKLISENFNLFKVRKDQIIISDTEDCDKLFFIIKGSLRIFYFTPLNVEVTRTFILENEFCTNLISFSGQAVNKENIQALEDTFVFYIRRKNFYEMLAQSHVLTELYAKILEQFIARHLSHFQFMNMLTPKERVEKFLTDSIEINRRVKDKIIATYLGVTPEYFSKTKNAFYKK